MKLTNFSQTIHSIFHPRLSIFVTLITFFILSSIFVLHPSITYADIPHLINYQGRLTDTNGVPLNGSYNLTFRIYDAETAGNLLWEETQTGVVVNKGIFAVLLGSVTNLNLAFDKPYFLEIKVGNEVMSPRQRMASGAYAFKAEAAEKAETAKNLEVTPQNGDILYYQDGWKTLHSPAEAGMFLTSQESGLPPIWTKLLLELQAFVEKPEEYLFDTSLEWVNYLTAEIRFSEPRLINYSASIEMGRGDNACAMARITIDSNVVSSERTSCGDLQYFGFSGNTEQKLSAGLHKVTIQIRTDRHNLGKWKNAKLTVRAPVP